MVTSVLTEQIGRNELEELLRPEALADGAEPEQRAVFCGISWNHYLSFDKKLGDDRPGPHLYFLDGELEIMTTSIEHERLKEWIGGLVEIFFDETETEVTPRGQATMRAPLKTAGAEPDKSWCIGEEKKFPDLVLEIALTSGGVNKLEVYRRFKVREVWICRRRKLAIFGLSTAGKYESLRKSHLLPGLDISLIEQCLAMDSWRQARQTFRQSLSKSRQNK